jgi:hypothetical protein
MQINKAEPVSGYPFNVGSQTAGVAKVIKAASQKAEVREDRTKEEETQLRISVNGKRYTRDKPIIYTMRDDPNIKIKGLISRVCKSL